MRGLVLAIAMLAAAVPFTAPASRTGGAGSPRVYLDHALTLMRRNAVVVPAGGWTEVDRAARRMAAHAKRPADTYGAITYAIEQLLQAGDLHAEFESPHAATRAARAAKKAETATTPAPTVSLIGGRIGVIVLPGVASSPAAPNSRRYVARALSAIAALERTSEPCGWIVDLREDTGGDMWPMLLSLGPLLGGGRLVGFTTRSGFAGYVSYRPGVLSMGRYRVVAPLAVPTFDPPPPVAVLTGPATTSSGEAVTIAFRGRANTRSFGSPTAGAPTSPKTYRLANGATIAFSIANDVDRRGVVYEGPISPDQITIPPDSSATEVTARTWLLATSSCSAIGRQS